MVNKVFSKEGLLQKMSQCFVGQIKYFRCNQVAGNNVGIKKGNGFRYSTNEKVYFLTSLEYLGTNAIKFKGLTSTLVVAKKDSSLPFGIYSETITQTVTGTLMAEDVTQWLHRLFCFFYWRQ